ncbi:hypothetical protein B0T18DRAFT_426723 [Schizothecium vesticola]|uniref:Ricin B lectin domain-containing protein n=1 Tax=Schizothecium vesticola TaxID=314040 RepID=A0AA40KAN4_9PEZI|nr:hypothetical protein B0T18DRAFT_426723 [Schizothecium vesticola]
MHLLPFLALLPLALSQTAPAPRLVILTTAVNAKFAIEPKSLPAKAGVQLVVQPLSATKAAQHWALLTTNSTTTPTKTTTRIQLANTTLCIDAGAKSNWKDMARVSLAECADTADGQRWTVMADGRVAVEGSAAPQSCIDLEYMRATAGNPVGLYTCAGLGGTGAADKGIVWGFVDVV